MGLAWFKNRIITHQPPTFAHSLRDVSCPLLVWSGCRKILIQQIGRDVERVIAVRSGLIFLGSDNLDAIITHQTATLAEIDAALLARIQVDADLARRFEILCSIPSIGRITAAALLIDMPELGSLDNKQIASLAGLAPMTRQSVRWSGRARIRGGRRQIRITLYMTAGELGREWPV